MTTATIFRTETKLFFREPMSVFWLLAFPTILLVILGSIPSFREAKPDLGGQRVVDMYVGVTVLLSMIMAAIQTMPAVLSTYRERRILRRFRTTPVRPISLLLTQIGIHLAAVTASTALVLTVGHIAFDCPVPKSLIGYLVAYVLAVLVTFAIGALITALSPNSRAATAVGMVFFFPSMFTAGVYFPVQTMSGLLHAIVVATPHGAAAEALNSALLGHFPQWSNLGTMAAWTVVLAAIAARTFRWE